MCISEIYRLGIQRELPKDTSIGASLWPLNHNPNCDYFHNWLVQW
jgi:hypothetical protein